MQCGECHELDVANKKFLPISFEKHCRSCHSLSFDEQFPERQAIHGDPVAMRSDLRGFYASLALTGQIADPAAPAIVRRGAPGRELTPDQRRAALLWVDQQVRRTSDFLMRPPGARDPRSAPSSQGACAECHAVVSVAAKDGGDGVAPVEFTHIWFPKAEFSHRVHAPFACKECHAAAAVYDPDFAPGRQRPAWSLPGARPYELLLRDDLPVGKRPSEASSDILIPEIAQCRTCHAGSTAQPPKVASQCVLCHVFHRPDNGPMRPADRPQGGVAAAPLSALGGLL